MPATITHTYFSIDVYGCLPDKIKENIDFDLLKTFSHSTDPFMFYNLVPFKKGKEIRKFQSYFHNNKSREFFIHLIRYIKTNDLYNNKDVNAYLVGFINHYILDSNVHPYVYYKTGKFKKNDKKTHKYNNIHHFMETFIDNDMVRRRENINPYKFNINKYCFYIEPFSYELNKVIDFSFYKTFNKKDMANIYYKALKDMRHYYRFYRRDRFGIKKFFYKFIDSFTPSSCKRLEAISYHYPLIDKHNFLNSNNSKWCYPTDDKITSNESFIDLYMKSLRQSHDIICKIYDYFNGKNIDLEKIIPNNSYCTGKDCTLKEQYKFFEY